MGDTDSTSGAPPRRPAADRLPGSWGARPTGVPATVPPPYLPLGFLAAAAVGLVACGVAVALVRTSATTDPTADPVVAAVHLGVLATLATGILGALHQFTPVITGRPLRSVRRGVATLVTWVLASWLLVAGVAGGYPAIAALSGVLALLAIVLVVTNLAGPLRVAGKGAPVLGLRLSLVGAVLTSLLGMTFVLDRRESWFGLSGHADVAMGVVGLVAWLGVTYMGVAQKLWPMFLLAHVPTRRPVGTYAVSLSFAGSTTLAVGLGWGISAAGVLGAATLAAGVAAHVGSLLIHVRHRRRGVDVYLVVTLTSAGWLVPAAGLGLASELVVGSHHHVGVALAAGALAAVGGWLLEALVGHAHKVVPFIVWSMLRAWGVAQGPAGRPLMFSDLYNATAFVASYVTTTLGIAGLCAGLASAVPALVATGGVLLALSGLVTAANLAIVPWRLAHTVATRATGPAVPPSPGHDLVASR